MTSRQIENKIKLAFQAAAADQINLADSEAVDEFVARLPASIRGTVGGNTSCISVETSEDLVIIDAGTGIRELGDALMEREFGQGQGEAAIFFTHTHWDHIQGFPFFRPLFVPGNRFKVYYLHSHAEQVLREQMNAQWFPIQFNRVEADMQFERIEEGQTLRVGAMTVSSKALQHPGKAYSYRVENGASALVLATDGEYKNLSATHTKEYIDFFAGADVLVFDAMYSVRESIIREDWGHSSALIGADIARQAGVKQLVLFHQDPAAEDDEVWRVSAETREYMSQDLGNALPRVLVATEGLEIDLSDAPDFGVTTQQVGNVAVLSLQGRFDAYGAEVFTNQFDQLLRQDDRSRIVLSMQDVTELNMAGVKALLEARTQTYGLALVKLPVHIRRVLELAVTVDFFAIYDDLDMALEALSISNNNHYETA